MLPKLKKERALFVLTKIDEILAWEQRKEAERDTRFVELGRYLCEVRAGQYRRLENLKSFDEFLERRFPESLCGDDLCGLSGRSKPGEREPRDPAAIHHEVVQVPARAGEEGIPGASERERFMSGIDLKKPRIKLAPDAYEKLRKEVLQREHWRCQNCGSMQNLEVHHQTLRSQSGDDSELNLITLCSMCHEVTHS